MEIREFKEGTKQAAAYLAAAGIEVPHTQLLEALSRAFGHRNWSTMRATAADTAAAEKRGVWAPGAEPMPQDLFAQEGGARCPVCGSHSVESLSLEADGPDAWDESTCSDCGSSWNCSYRLTGYFDLDLGEGIEASSQVDATREHVVETLVDDVRARAAKYGFSYSGQRQAERLARESADVLDLDATDAEVLEAASRLA